MSFLQNDLFAQYLRYAKNFILGISTICLRQNFSHASILNENLHFARGSNNKKGSSRGIFIIGTLRYLVFEQ